MPRSFISSNDTLHGGTPRKVMYGEKASFDAENQSTGLVAVLDAHGTPMDNMHITYLGS
jgi:hypothetical protein